MGSYSVGHQRKVIPSAIEHHKEEPVLLGFGKFVTMTFLGLKANQFARHFVAIACSEVDLNKQWQP